MNKTINHQDIRTCTVISLGTELTRGLVRDSHAVFLGQEITKHGILVKRILFIPDEYEICKNELLQAIADSSMVIITGGLGPTSDDLTREIVADAAHKRLVFIEDAWDTIKKRSWGKKVPESNKKQAFIPEDFTIIKNPSGTACGFRGTIGDTEVIALPGPPYELQSMFLKFVAPFIKSSFTIKKCNELVCSVYMVSESYLEDCFQKARYGEVSIQTRIEKDRIVCTLYGSTKSGQEKTFSGLSELLGKSRIRKGNISLAESVLNLLLKKKMMLVCAESCTGGLLSTWITGIPGSSKAFWGSFITYSNKAKENCLGVDSSLIRENGAVSKEVVSSMAQGGLEKSQGDICIAVSGIAGPDGGSKEKPVGTVWIALHTKKGMKDAKCFKFTGNRVVVRKKSAVTCFFFAESALLGNNVLDIPLKW